MFNGVEAHPIIRVIGPIRSISIYSHARPIGEGLNSRCAARPGDRRMVPKELLSLGMVRRSTRSGTHHQDDDHG